MAFLKNWPPLDFFISGYNPIFVCICVRVCLAMFECRTSIPNFVRVYQMSHLSSPPYPPESSTTVLSLSEYTDNKNLLFLTTTMIHDTSEGPLGRGGVKNAKLWFLGPGTHFQECTHSGIPSQNQVD